MIMRNRRMVVGLSVLLTMALSICCVGYGSSSEPRYGGTLTYATTGDIAIFDYMINSNNALQIPAGNIYERLATVNETFGVVPELSTRWEVSTDYTKWTFYLRKGVLFHNGKEMTASDVEASFLRYNEVGERKAEYHVDEIIVIDDYTVELVLPRPNVDFALHCALHMTAPVIMPREVCLTPDGQIRETLRVPEDIVGTGPYKLEEWVPGEKVVLGKFEDYVPNEAFDEPTGLGGRKTAYLDRINIVSVSESGARLAGLLSGEYDVAQPVSAVEYEGLKSNPEVGAFLAQPMRWRVELFLNPLDPSPFKDPIMRRAVQVALNHDPIMYVVADGIEDLYVLTASRFLDTEWYVPEPEDLWNVADREEAKRLLEEAGYKGEPLKFVTTKDYDFMFKSALVIYQQLTDAGFNIDLQVMDWPSMAGLWMPRNPHPDKWDLSQTGYSPKVHPVAMSVMYYGPSHLYSYNNDEMNALWEKFSSTLEYEERYEIWEEIQKLRFELPLPFISIGGVYEVGATRANVKGFVPWKLPRFWNMWLE